MTTRRVVLIVSAALLAIALAALGVVVAILGSERGARWSLQLANDQIPQLSVDDIHGDWLRGLHLTQLQWRDDKTEVRLRDLSVRLHWPSLLHGEIKLSTLRADELRIESKGESDDQPIKLPRLFLPITLTAPDFAVQQLLIVNGATTTALDRIAAAVRWRATTLLTRNLRVSWKDLTVQATGDIGLRGDYPLRLKGELRTPYLAEPIALQTEGDLRQLLIHATVAAPYALRGDITLATLDKHLPLTVAATIAQSIVRTLPTGDLTINAATLNAHGDLNRIEATLSATLTEPHYGATQLTAAAQWQPEQLRASAQWRLPNSGEFSAECTATLNESLATNCTGTANSIALTPWLNGPNGNISSTFKLDASRRDQQWALALQLPDLRGQIGAEKFSGQLDLATADFAQWQVHTLELNNGPNKLRGSGKFGTQNQAQLELDAGNLARLSPQLSGSLNAKINLDGQWPQPDLRVQWRGAKLRFEQSLLERTRGEINLRKLGNDNSLLRVDAQQLIYADHPPLDLTLSISGKRTQQELVLVVQQMMRQNNQRVRLQCNTQPAPNWLDWQINCPALTGSVQIDSIRANWQNNNPIDGHLTLEPPASDKSSSYRVSAAELKPFCLRSQDAELCLDQALRYARNTLQPIAVHGTGLPLRWLAAWLPRDLQLQNDARATLQMRLQNISPLQADAHLAIANTQWSWPTATGNQSAEINAIKFDGTLDEKRALLSASAQSPTLGSLNAQLAIRDPRTTRELDGRLQLEHIQLAGFAVLVPELDVFNGEINGDLRISGTTKAPQLHGQLLLRDATASWGPLGAPFRTINAELIFDNNSARLGGWFALGQGGGDIEGSMHWDGAGDNLQMQVKLVAGGLSASPLPNSTIVFSPHIEANATPGEVHITGYVDVARADFELKQLPPHTVDVSQDQQLVGDLSDADATHVWADIGLNLGEQFHFQGLGADVNLSGKLQIAKKPGDALHVTGEVRVPRGRYRAYGQRLTIRKGSFIFYGPLENPDLNLEAVRDMPIGVTDVVGLRVIGSLKTPEALLFSEPSLASDSDIAYYLLTGHKPTTNSGSGPNASGALLSLGMAGSESTAGRLASKFGIRDLQLGTTETSAGDTEAEVSGQLSDDLQVRYGHDIGQRANSISFQYRLTPKLVIETISGIENALDLLYSFEIK